MAATTTVLLITGFLGSGKTDFSKGLYELNTKI